MGACARWGAKGGRCLWENLLLYRPLLRPEAPELASPLKVVFPAIPRRKQDEQDIQINYTKERWPLSWVPDVSSSLFGWDSALVALATEDPQFSDSAQSCPTLCEPMDCSTPGFPVHHQFPELTQTLVRWVGDAIQPSHPLSSFSPPAFRHSQHQGLFKWVSSSHQVAKVLEFQLQHQSFQWIFRTGFL